MKRADRGALLRFKIQQAELTPDGKGTGLRCGGILPVSSRGETGGQLRPGGIRTSGSRLRAGGIRVPRSRQNRKGAYGAASGAAERMKKPEDPENQGRKSLKRAP